MNLLLSRMSLMISDMYARMQSYTTRCGVVCCFRGAHSPRYASKRSEVCSCHKPVLVPAWVACTRERLANGSGPKIDLAHPLEHLVVRHLFPLRDLASYWLRIRSSPFGGVEKREITQIPTSIPLIDRKSNLKRIESAKIRVWRQTRSAIKFAVDQTVDEDQKL